MQQLIALPKKVVHSRIAALQEILESCLVEEDHVWPAALISGDKIQVGAGVASVGGHCTQW